MDLYHSNRLSTVIWYIRILQLIQPFDPSRFILHLFVIFTEMLVVCSNWTGFYIYVFKLMSCIAILVSLIETRYVFNWFHWFVSLKYFDCIGLSFLKIGSFDLKLKSLTSVNVRLNVKFINI